MSWPEFCAVALALLYVLLAIRERRSCWLAGGVSAAIYLWVFSTAQLYMESALQVFYIGMAGYGWLHWGRDNSSMQLAIGRLPLRAHAVILAGIAIATLALGTLLANFTNAALPWLDTATTVGALIATWLTTRKVLENWIYWIVIDLASIYLYGSRGLDASAALFGLYVVLAAAGFVQWRQHFRQQADNALRDGVPA